MTDLNRIKELTGALGESQARVSTLEADIEFARGKSERDITKLRAQVQRLKSENQALLAGMGRP